MKILASILSFLRKAMAPETADEKKRKTERKAERQRLKEIEAKRGRPVNCANWHGTTGSFWSMSGSSGLYDAPSHCQRSIEYIRGERKFIDKCNVCGNYLCKPCAEQEFENGCCQDCASENVAMYHLERQKEREREEMREIVREELAGGAAK